MSSSVRCLAVWGAATASAALLVGWLLPESVGGAIADSGSFQQLLVSGCALAAATSVAWLWGLVTLVVLEALRGGSTGHAVPGVVRRLVLTACGLTLAGGVAVPAHADRPAPPPESPASSAQTVLVGLPLPDRTTTTTQWSGALGTRGAPAAPAPAPDPPPPPAGIRVAPGDTLWGIARHTLPADAAADEIDRRWREIYRANRDTVGADPDLIRPGQRLLLPPIPSRPR